MKDYVILVHGLARTSRSMKKPQRFLEDKGYCVLNVDYPSTKYPLEILAQDFLADFIRRQCTERSKQIHFVTHSMGGILVRQYIKTFHPPNLGRVVMLAPPNQGSELVDWEKKWRIFRWMLGPAGQQLGTDRASLPAQLGPVNFATGVIAGDRNIEFYHAWLLPELSDGKVSLERTKVEGMQDFLVVHQTHTFIMRDHAVLRQTEHFLRTGKFQRNFRKSP